MTKNLSVAQKNRIGLAYLTNIVGADKEIIRGFLKGEFNAHYFVGMRQCGDDEGRTPAGEMKSDYNGFWKDVRVIDSGNVLEDLPNLASDGEVEVKILLSGLNSNQLKKQARVINLIQENACMYR